MSPHTAVPYEPMRVAQVEMPLVRIPKLRRATQIPGGWCEPGAFIPAPSGYRWNRKVAEYQRTKKDQDGNVIVLARITQEECRAQWRAVMGNGGADVDAQ